jgi:hypothetical protein
LLYQLCLAGLLADALALIQHLADAHQLAKLMELATRK